ncbi:hypothetical protein [Stenotrophomonas maltophilia]|uniref:hypothetical protein n=1 Tax=Stenotrophomonas maltophilia TaxID=40324 RepID=UPI0013121B04|nr:hypothetical protein [Stenotrophomonas maltophilia]MCF3519740.1 hypothetical protein [Stenotrophomonas maltophilia]
MNSEQIGSLVQTELLRCGVPQESLTYRGDERKVRPMGDMNREEVKAKLEASEARVATTLELMRRENAEFRGEIKSSFSSMHSDNAEFRAEMREAIASMSVSLSNQARDFERGISGLKIWVLAGALAGVISLGKVYLDSQIKVAATEMQRQTTDQKERTPPAVEKRP